MANLIAAQLQPLNNAFSFSDHDVRTALDDSGEPWFCAKDVYEALGIVWKNRAGSLMKTPEKWICTCYLQGQSGTGEVLFIAEPAVYQALFKSNKPQALAMVEWVCEEVLPSIRRQGFYGSATAGQQIALRTQKLKLLEKLSSTRDAFVAEAVTADLRDVCNALGQRMPSLNLLGQDRDQLPLAGV